MAIKPDQNWISIDDYLQGEMTSETRHEYVGGDVYAMVGASDRHNIIAGNLFAALRPHTRGTTCQLFIADMKVRVDLKMAGIEAFYYPDLMLACEPEDREPYYRTKPCMLVEVLSEATQRIDRREKFLSYTRIDSLQEYVLIHQDQKQVEVFRRDKDWEVRTLIDGDLDIQCMGDVKVPLAHIYEDIPFS
jgi:Uma2 family endonuclease